MARKLACTLLTITLMACGGMTVDSAQDPELDITSMTTFQWMDRPQPEVSRRAIREGLDERIRAAVNSGLADRGLTQVAARDAELILAYYVGLDGAYDVMRVNTYPDSRWGVGRGWDRYTERSDRLMEAGTLVLDAFDAGTGKLAWRGVAEAEIDRTQSPEKRAELVNKAVERLLGEFPVGN